MNKKNLSLLIFLMLSAVSLPAAIQHCHTGIILAAELTKSNVQVSRICRHERSLQLSPSNRIIYGISASLTTHWKSMVRHTPVWRSAATTVLNILQKTSAAPMPSSCFLLPMPHKFQQATKSMPYSKAIFLRRKTGIMSD